MESDREIIFKNIKRALNGNREKIVPSPELDEAIEEKLNFLTPTNEEELLEQFKTELEKVNAEFILLKNREELSSLIQKLLKNENEKIIAISGEDEILEIAESLKGIESVNAKEFEYEERKERISKIRVALISAGAAIADIGTVVFFYDETGTTYPHFLCDWILVLVRKGNIVANQFEFFRQNDSDKMRNMVFVTGPSRTADIEKTLILGAHGPRKMTVIVV